MSKRHLSPLHLLQGWSSMYACKASGGCGAMTLAGMAGRSEIGRFCGVPSHPSPPSRLYTTHTRTHAHSPTHTATEDARRGYCTQPASWGHVFVRIGRREQPHHPSPMLPPRPPSPSLPPSHHPHAHMHTQPHPSTHTATGGVLRRLPAHAGVVVVMPLKELEGGSSP